MAKEVLPKTNFPAYFDDLKRRIDDQFEDLFGGGDGGWKPAVDVVREKDKLLLHADIPGVKPDEVELTVRDNILTLHGEHKETKEEKDQDYVRRERHYGSFTRSLTLPKGVPTDEIEAKFHDGVLDVTVPLPPKETEDVVKIMPTVE